MITLLVCLASGLVLGAALAQSARLFTARRHPVAIDLHPTSTETTNGSSNALHVEQYSEMLVALNITDAQGSAPVLDVFVETSDDAGTTWYPHSVLAHGLVGATQQTLSLGRGSTGGAFGHHLRVRWAVSGPSSSFTFAVRAAPKLH